MPLPANFFKWNRALRCAYLKGVEAYLADEPLTACPYKDKRKPSGRVSWSRAFISAWRDGWEYAKKDSSDALITLEYSGRGRR